MSNIKYRYFVFKSLCIARLEKGRDTLDPKEFYYNGVWQYDDELNLNLNDAIMDYGDYSVFDYDEITEEEAFKRIGSHCNSTNINVNHCNAIMDTFRKSLEALRAKYQDDAEALEEIERAENTAIYYCNKGEFEKINSELAQLEAVLHDWY